MRDGVGRLRAVQIFAGPRCSSCSLRRTEASSCCNCCWSSGISNTARSLPLFHVSSVIDVEFLDVAGNFRVHVHFLKRLKFRRDLQVVRNVSSRTFTTAAVGSV